MSGDTKLIIACLAKDKQAWDIFVDKYSRLICHAIVITLKKHSTAPENQVVDDLFHTVFLSLIEKIIKNSVKIHINLYICIYIMSSLVAISSATMKMSSDHVELRTPTI